MATTKVKTLEEVKEEIGLKVLTHVVKVDKKEVKDELMGISKWGGFVEKVGPSDKEYLTVATKDKLFKKDFPYGTSEVTEVSVLPIDENTFTLKPERSMTVRVRVYKCKELFPHAYVEEMAQGNVIATLKTKAKGEIPDKHLAEKLATRARGRALSLMGYNLNGELASFEDMMDVKDVMAANKPDEPATKSKPAAKVDKAVKNFKKAGDVEVIGAYEKKLEGAASKEELKAIWVSIPNGDAKRALIKVKDEMVKKFDGGAK